MALQAKHPCGFVQLDLEKLSSVGCSDKDNQKHRLNKQKTKSEQN